MTPRMSNKKLSNRNILYGTRTRPLAINAAYAKIMQSDMMMMRRSNRRSRRNEAFADERSQDDVLMRVNADIDDDEVGDGLVAGTATRRTKNTFDKSKTNNNNNNNSNTHTPLSRTVRTTSTPTPTATLASASTSGTTTSLLTSASASTTIPTIPTSTTTRSRSHRIKNVQPTCWRTAAACFWHRSPFLLSLSQSLLAPRWYNVIVIALLLLTTTTTNCLSVAAASASSSPCESNNWWDPVRDKCIPCTVCQGEMIPLRPCQLHRDTICGSIYDLKIDWVVLAKTEPNWKERRKSEYELEHLMHHASSASSSQLQHLTAEQLQQLHDEAIPLDWQTGALFLAVLACLLFFLVAACILIHHMRQWRRMERRLDQDVEELSTKLMAKLAEVQSLEGGTFFIGNADALRIPTTTFQPQHVLLPAEKPSKQHERRVLKTLQPGNVYIEENGSKG